MASIYFKIMLEGRGEGGTGIEETRLTMSWLIVE